MQKLQYWVLGIFCAVSFWFGSIATVRADSSLPQSSVKHILERLSFGSTAAQLTEVKQRGIEAYLQEQLEPQTVTESKILQEYLQEFADLNHKPLEWQRQHRVIGQKRKKHSNLFSPPAKKLKKQQDRLKKTAKDLATEIHLVRAIYSSRQLQEVMVDFWYNHFNVFASKGKTPFWIDNYENRIRRHALGNFRDLLEATASHPAMLIYLDNQYNSDPNSPNAKGKYQGLNENYARELMELHTLGVNGGYSQEDIITLARIFTGWTVAYNGKQGNEIGFFFNSKRHDPQEKVFLGHKITAQGIEEGRQALDILANHPATAHFISYKLAQYFVADIPPETLVNQLAAKFLESQGDIKVVMNALIHSPEFYQPQADWKKFKTPYQYLVSLVRLAEIEQPDFLRLQGMLSQLSMPVFLCVPPTGYKNTQEAWLNPQAMLQRITFAKAIADRRLNPESKIEYQKIVRNLGKLSPRTKKAIASAPKLRSALVLSSPEAMYR